jgi:antirestriction protein ArdC
MTAMERGYRDTRWLTFKQALDQGGHVKKGEKGTKVVFWKKLEKEDDEGEKKKILLAREYTVFNVEQCEGLAVIPTGNSHVPTEDEVLEMVKGVGVVVQEGGARACYIPSLDVVQMPSAKDFADQGAYRSVLLHETAHWTGHASRLNRDFSGRFGSEAYAFEELVAELGSAFMCATLGVEGKLQHAEYIANWLQVLKGDKFAVFTAARLAQEAMELVLGDAAEEEELAAAA